MSVFAIVLVYLTLGQPARIVVPAATVAVESLPDCEAVLRPLLQKHAFDRKGLVLVDAECERVTVFYRTDGTKL